jgi:hypothetical protein
MKVQTLVGLAATALLAACATPKDDRMGHGPSHMNMEAMCEMHRQETAGKSPAEQQAAVEAHIKSMHGTADPSMVAMHQKMMDAHCASSASQK